MTIRILRTADEAQVVRDEIEEIVDEGWGYEGGRWDWEAFFDRLERRYDLDFGSDWSSPAIQRAKLIARKARVDGE